MSIRIRHPDTNRLELSQGDFLIVRRYLTAKEFRDMLRMSVTQPITKPEDYDATAGNLAAILAYLLDWSFADADGRPLTIVDQPPHVVRAALDRIDADAYIEVQDAVVRHANDIRAAIAEEKKTNSGVNASERISLSAAP